VEVAGGFQGKYAIVNGNAAPATSASSDVPLADMIARIKAIPDE